MCVRTAQGEERFEADDVGEALLPLLEAYKRCGVAVLDVTVGRGTLEQHFMDIAEGCMMGRFVWHGAAMAAGHPQQDAAHYLLCGAAFVFAMMGGIFTSVNPSARETLVPSMTVMGVSMGALIGLPPSLVEIYGSDIKKMYKANGVPLYFGLIIPAAAYPRRSCPHFCI